MMDDKEIIEKLSSLCQLDIDAFHAYGRALEHIEAAMLRDQIAKFQSDHERHVTDLSALISRLGGQPPEFSRDFKGFLLEGFTALRSMTGTEGAMKSLKSAEEMTNKRYGDARSWDMPLDIISLIQSNFEDEQRHLHYVEQSIDNRVWEAAGVSPK